MDFLKEYLNETDFSSAKATLDEPWIALAGEDDIHASLEPFDCLTFKAAEDNVTIQLNKTSDAPTKSFQYRVNSAPWEDWDMSAVTLDKGDRMYVKSDSASSLSTGNSNYHNFVITGNVYAGGNVMSLVNFSDSVPDYCFNALFHNCTGLLTAPKLPAMNLGIWCYYDMFSGCTSLAIAPELPATTLSAYCYASMFSSSGLKAMPKPQARVLAEACYMALVSACQNIVDASDFEFLNVEVPASAYYNMFWHCYNLKYLPAEINGISFGASACRGMFVDCTSLKTAPELPSMSITTHSYRSMFQGCTSLTKAPLILPAPLAGYCYTSMFEGCTALEKGPELPATTLSSSCYYKMFDGASKLKYIKIGFKTTATNSLVAWLRGVSTTGTLLQPADSTITRTTLGVPAGWTIETY